MITVMTRQGLWFWQGKGYDYDYEKAFNTKLNLDYLPEVRDRVVQRNFILRPAKDVEVSDNVILRLAKDVEVSDKQKFY